MKRYNEELDALFTDWETISEENGLLGFCKDGLIFKGQFFSTINANGIKHWSRHPGNEDEQWDTASKRILFLLKDPNKNPEADMRQWVSRQNSKIIRNRFFKTIALLLFGLDSIQKNGDFVCFKDANIPEKVSLAYDTIPFAIVNCKKESGGGKISNNVLLNYVSKYGNYLKNQIEILNPNIIICGGGGGAILKIVMETIYPDFKFQNINDWVYYNKDNNITLIDSWHPSNFTISYEEFYTDMMEAFQEHLKILNER